MQLGVILIVQSLKLQAESVVVFVMIVSIIQWEGTVSSVNHSFTKILVVISEIQISVKVIPTKYIVDVLHDVLDV